MRARHSWMLLVVGLLLLAALLVFTRSAPRLVDYFPYDGAADIPQDTPLHLSFSRPVQIEILEPYITIEPQIDGSIQWQGSKLIFTPDKPWPAGASIQVWLDAGARASDFPYIPMREGAYWTFEVHQPSLAYLYPAAGPASLYRVNPETGEVNLLLSSNAGLLDYTVSPLEPQIYYSEKKKGGGSLIYRFHIADPTEKVSTPLASQASPLPAPEMVLDCQNAACRSLALDPNGEYLAYERTALPGADGPEIPQIWILPIGEGVKQTPFLAGDPTHQTELPSWSAAGILAFYDRTDQLYRFVEPGFGDRTSFSNQTGAAGSWRQDGGAYLAAEIIFMKGSISAEIRDLGLLADSHLILFHLNEGRMEDLTPGDGIEDTAPVYSPSGEYLVFARKYLDIQNWTPGRQIWLARTTSRESRPLTNEPLYNHFDFSWSPASDQLVYVRFNQSSLSGPLEIWILNLLTGQTFQLVQDGYKPLWIP